MAMPIPAITPTTAGEVGDTADLDQAQRGGDHDGGEHRRRQVAEEAGYPEKQGDHGGRPDETGELGPRTGCLGDGRS
jgi:hypothetical protein